MPIYQVIASEVVELPASGVTFAEIGRRFRVDPKTVQKALQWFPDR